MNNRIALFLVVSLMMLAGSTRAQDQRSDSVSVEAGSSSSKEELIARRNRLNKTSRLFSVFTIAFTVSYVVTENETHHPSPYLVIGGLASATVALVTGIKAHRLDKKITALPTEKSD